MWGVYTTRASIFVAMTVSLTQFRTSEGIARTSHETRLRVSRRSDPSVAGKVHALAANISQTSMQRNVYAANVIVYSTPYGMRRFPDH